MYTYAVKRRPFVFEGNEIMRVSVSVPKTDSPSEISDFYSDISSNFINWCENSAFPRLCEEYMRLSQQKYTYRKRTYSLRADLTYASERLLCVLTQVKLTAFRSDARILFEEYQVWLPQTGELLPPKYAAKRICAELGADGTAIPKSISSAGTDGKSVFFTPLP